MFTETVLALSLIVPVSIDSGAIRRDGSTAPMAMSSYLKAALLGSAVGNATNCIANAVRADPHFISTSDPSFTNVIANVAPLCHRQLGALVRIYDEINGTGGEAFVLDEYLNTLPNVLTRRFDRHPE